MPPVCNPIHSSIRIQANRRRGVVLVVILWILVTLSVLALALSMNTRLTNTAQVVDAAKLKASWLARSGIARAVSMLTDDTNHLDGPMDLWYDNAEQFKKASMPDGSYTIYHQSPSPGRSLRYGVQDEAARLNLIWATVDQVRGLPDMTGPEAGQLLNWLEQNPPGPQRASHLRGQLYTLRQAATLDNFSVNFLYGEDLNLNGLLDPSEDDGAKSRPDDNQDHTLDTGLLHWLTLYSYDLEIDHEGQPRLNINEALLSQLTGELELAPEKARWIVHFRPFESITDLLAGPNSDPTDDILMVDDTTGMNPQDKRVAVRPSIDDFRQIADRIRVNNQSRTYGRININTAPPEIMAAAFELPTATVQKIIAYRNSLSKGFRERGELVEVAGLTTAELKRIIPRATVRSWVFRIRCRGQAAHSRQICDIEAVIDRGTQEALPQVLYWLEQD